MERGQMSSQNASFELVASHSERLGPTFQDQPETIVRLGNFSVYQNFVFDFPFWRGAPRSEWNRSGVFTVAIHECCHCKYDLVMILTVNVNRSTLNEQVTEGLMEGRILSSFVRHGGSRG